MVLAVASVLLLVLGRIDKMLSLESMMVAGGNASDVDCSYRIFVMVLTWCCAPSVIVTSQTSQP